MLLQKTLLAIEGLGRQLHPDLNLWDTAKPFLERWIRAQVAPAAVLRKVVEDAPYWIEKLPDLPILLHDVLRYRKYQQMSATEKAVNNAFGAQKRSRYRHFFVGFITAAAIIATLEIVGISYFHLLT